MAQSLLIGLGGTGSRVVNNVVKLLHRNGKKINDGQICCAVLDTNCNDNDFIRASGTNVPVIGTSKPQKIKDYFAEYPSMLEWSPDSPNFRMQSMLAGASETRVKSRIAFDECLHSDTIQGLEDLINDVLKQGDTDPLRIMLVSSLSGGTGSGMFLQVALWLRQLLSEREIVMRGIFMLPDIFIHTLRDIHDNNNKTRRHYANAYAAIRELNAITKVTQSNSAELMAHFEIDSLFDSTKDKSAGFPVFDYVFFVDYKDQNTTYLGGISDYEKMVADMVYMQLYSPMAANMKSEEDNFFQDFVANLVPKYGACGTSKAVYPVDSVKAYCAIRAVQDALPEGWEQIDKEIDKRIQDKKRAELENGSSGGVIDPRYEYIRLFDEKAAAGEDALSRNKFFATLREETQNVKKGARDVNGEFIPIKTDKIDDFVRALKKERIARTVVKHGHLSACAIDVDSFVEDDRTVDELQQVIEEKETKVTACLKAFDEKVDEHALAVANGVFSDSMADVTEANRCSIHGLLTKLNDKTGKWDYVHPLVARYLCYQLVARLEKEMAKINLTSSYDNAITGGNINERRQIFDMALTLKKEISAEDMLKNKPFFVGEETFTDWVEKAYATFMAKKLDYCDVYMNESLQLRVYRKLIERVNLLIKQLESFFKSLPDIRESLADGLEKNVSNTGGITGTTLYVYASQENKEQVYRTLDLGQNDHNTDLNKSIINAAYGRVCAELNPDEASNENYKKMTAAAAFVHEALGSFRSRINANTDNRAAVELDLCTALRKEAEAKYKASGEADRVEGLESINYEGTEEIKKDDTNQRYEDAFMACRNWLIKAAAPFLRHEKQVKEKDEDPDAAWPKTFWGYHPALVAAYPNFGKDLKINEELQANDAYPRNELHCYRAVYGMEARYIPKFNEMNNGDYYRNYKLIVDDMVARAHGEAEHPAYVSTLHLDKSWHRILPFVTEEMQNVEAQRFFRGLWLGIAYGKVIVGKDDNMYVRRTVDAGYGNLMDKDVSVMYRGKPVGKTEVAKLVSALRMDIMFTSVDIPGYEADFQEELDSMDTYIGTKVMQGLVKKNEFLQPVDVIGRYCSATGQATAAVGAMIGGLEEIAFALASHYYMERSEDSVNRTKFDLCRQFYVAATRKKLGTKIDPFRKWRETFTDLKLEGFKREGETATETVEE